jgi:hypothetical protein
MSIGIGKEARIAPLEKKKVTSNAELLLPVLWFLEIAPRMPYLTR